VRAVVIDDALPPDAALLHGRQKRENRSVFERNDFLIIVAVCDPALDLPFGQHPLHQTLMEGVFVVVSFRADRMKARNKIRRRG
jgi:hypothetical protein